MHDAVELSLRVLPASWERNEDLAGVGEGPDGRAGRVTGVDQRPVECHADGTAAEHQGVGLSCFETRCVIG